MYDVLISTKHIAFSPTSDIFTLKNKGVFFVFRLRNSNLPSRGM